MPAAAVIPAPIAYIKVVAVKKLVVGLVCAVRGWPAPKRAFRFGPGGALKSSWGDVGLNWSATARRLLGYCEKIRVFKAGIGCN